MDRYKLDEHGNPVRCDDPLEFGRWYETAERHVALTSVSDDVRVSTVFLAIDHRYDRTGPPILWETMIFGGEHNEYQERYSTREAAVQGHDRAVRMTKGEPK